MRTSSPAQTNKAGGPPSHPAAASSSIAKHTTIQKPPGRRASRQKHILTSVNPVSRSPPPSRAQPALTPAEAYASAHTAANAEPSPHGLPAQNANGVAKKRPGGETKPAATAVSAGKPLFDWLSRKLGGRRASIADGLNIAGSGSKSSTAPDRAASQERYPTLSRSQGSTNASRNLSNSWTQGGDFRTPDKKASPARIKRDHPNDRQPQSPALRSSLGRSESQSLHSFLYPTRQPSERRRQANNPYPSLPVPPLQRHRESTIDSSLRTRSRTPSISSVNSFTSSPARMSMGYADEGDSVSVPPNSPLSRLRHSRFAAAATAAAGGGADEDASLRAFPPSLAGSPRPDGSVLSNYTPTSLASPWVVDSPMVRDRTARRLFQPQRQDSAESDGREGGSGSSSDREGLGGESRRDSASTKPTTVLSFESGPHVAHIAQAPPPIPANASSTSGAHLREAAVNGSNLSPPASPLFPTTPTTPTTPMQSLPASPIRPTGTDLSESIHISASPHAVTQAPKRSAPHPRDNPHPSAIPDANASTLTLASSTFAAPQALFGSSWTPSTTPALPQAAQLGGPPRMSASQGLAESSRAAQAVRSASSQHRSVAIARLSLGPTLEPQPVNDAHPDAQAPSPSLSTGPSLASGHVARPSSLLANGQILFSRTDRERDREAVLAPPVAGQSVAGPRSDRPTSTIDTHSLYSYSYAPSLHPTMATSLRTGGWAGGRYGAADRDASVRALRRKGSWESYESDWSWKGAAVPPAQIPAASTSSQPASISGGNGGPAPPSVNSKPGSTTGASSSDRGRRAEVEHGGAQRASLISTTDDCLRDSMRERHRLVSPALSGEIAAGA